MTRRCFFLDDFTSTSLRVLLNYIIYWIYAISVIRTMTSRHPVDPNTKTPPFNKGMPPMIKLCRSSIFRIESWFLSESMINLSVSYWIERNSDWASFSYERRAIYWVSNSCACGARAVGENCTPPRFWNEWPEGLRAYTKKTMNPKILEENIQKPIEGQIFCSSIPFFFLFSPISAPHERGARGAPQEISNIPTVSHHLRLITLK